MSKSFSPKNLPPVSPAAVAALCRAASCSVPESAFPDLALYLELLMRWNAAINLVGARTWQTALTTLVVDSFHLAEFLDALVPGTTPLVWDLGAGAGLPGIPLRMVWPQGTYYMVEAREKRAIFLSTVLSRIVLPDTRVFQGRAEAFFAAQPRKADVILSRAFMPWPDVLKLVRGQLAPGGAVVFLALEPPPEELPPFWRCRARRAYVANGSRRWFWAVETAGEMA